MEQTVKRWRLGAMKESGPDRRPRSDVPGHQWTWLESLLHSLDCCLGEVLET